ncbi:kinase that interacts with cdc31p [Tritrichomonas musculus]|uniref:Kinase that interacts with cdc31p n=1 Tax=Tritrichomonas musculus TaxID=1915356 RepID=A0ABR2KN61_9EUKA
MKKAINDFQNLLEKKNINTTNQYLKEILYKFEFIFSPDILQAEKAIQYENNSKIIIVGECIQDNIKYYVLCFEYKLLILPNEGQEVSSILAAITNSDDCDIYFVPSDDMIFLYEIQHFSREFRIDNENIQHFWSNVVNCLCGFLIKKGYQNSRNKNCKYLKEKTMNKEFVEYKEENANYANKSYIELRNIGNGAGGTVYLIYLIHKEEVYALKIPNVESLHLIERERNNYLNLRYPFVVPYIGYIKFYNRPKYLLLEYVEGETLDKYKLNNLNDEEKYNIILELLLTIDYLHSQKYIYNDFLFGNIMINQNKGAILIDFDRVRKVNDKTEDEEHTQNLCCEASAPEKIKTYKSDVYSLSYI